MNSSEKIKLTYTSSGRSYPGTATPSTMTCDHCRLLFNACRRQEQYRSEFRGVVGWNCLREVVYIPSKRGVVGAVYKIYICIYTNR